MKKVRTMESSVKSETQPVVSGEEERSHPSTGCVEKDACPATPQGSDQTKSLTEPRHPKGHKVHKIEDIWKIMDSDNFLRVTDTVALSDVWVQPLSVEPSTTGISNVTFKQVIFAPHIKQRDATCKMSLDDILKMLYLNDCLQHDMQGMARPSFDDWLKDKSSRCVRALGPTDGCNRSRLCDFIIRNDESFSFYPPFLKSTFSVFFRKTCYHSYKTENKDEAKLSNPAIMKCCALRGKFEYVLEARIMPLPDEWFSSPSGVIETQPI